MSERPSKLVKPRRLRPGGTVGIVAPASPAEDSLVHRGAQWWQERGYRTKLGKNIFAKDYYLAGPAEARAEDLMSMFADPDVDAIHVTQGGYGSAQLIPLLDFSVIAANPKPFIGMSDITSVQVAMLRYAGLVTFYGPGAVRVATSRSETTGTRLLDVLTHGGAGPLPRAPEFPYVRLLGSGRATATLIGGDVYELRASLGTPFEIDTDDAILFFEDEGNPPWQVDGILDQLGHAGKLDSVRGLALGLFVNCDWTEEKRKWAATKTLEQVLDYYLRDLGVPALYGLPIGHGEHSLTIPLGVAATLDADAQTLFFEESAIVP